MDEVTRVRDLSAARLRAARLVKSLSIADAAETVGVPKSTWQKWEEGSPPSATVAARVADLLGSTVEAIWGSAASAPSESADAVSIPTEAA